MVTIAHIIHPVQVAGTSDLVIAQPITFETMDRAREFTAGTADVSLYAVQYEDEEQMMLPKSFIRNPGINRSIIDLLTLKQKRKLALIKDIMDNLYYNSDDEYLIYTNVDIALQPYFYQFTAKIIRQGYDAFIINRRTVSDTYKHPEEIPLMYADIGEKHKGWDCFIFKRSLYPNFDLGTACIGTNWVGRVMITNMACFAKKFKIFEDLHLTFHIGNERLWKSDRFEDYTRHNREECKRILVNFEKKFGAFNRDEVPGRFFRLIEKEEKNEK
jgi:hypothetical protein